MARGARYVLQESHVKANDPHYDAKCYPHMHPYVLSLNECVIRVKAVPCLFTAVQ